MDRRLQDCYFFYYSTCTKGEHCGFRHEPSALGCETVCQFWQQGKCTNQQCHLRHMELKKNRKTIPCYWENQPSGCRKPHCPFMHKAPRDGPTVLDGDRKERVEQAPRPRPEQAPPSHPAMPPAHQPIPQPHQTHQQMTPTHQPMPLPEPLIVSFQDTLHMY